jgi:hypothetical protein
MYYTAQTMIYIKAVELQITEESYCTCPLTAIWKGDILFSNINKYLPCNDQIYEAQAVCVCVCVCVCTWRGYT